MGSTISNPDDMPFCLPAEDPNLFTILLMGRPGDGKSLISNLLIDGRDTGRFKSGQCAEIGLTKKVQGETGTLFG